ncbi:60S ribosomal protein L29-like [Phyllostomus hastatus]|uniref:60S ribosomal protein L29-like n=1 Tax=Phyllostomus hastatus TaxID=9423 RepID=UPI001E681D5E|nr:60S ribosomal protein L29-like [Phyllostomus hastatus]
MHYAKKHQKSLKKMPTRNTKAGVKPKVPKSGSHKLNGLGRHAHSNLGKHVHASVAWGLKLCQPKAKAKAQIKPQVGAAAPAQAPKGAQAPTKTPQ